MLPPPCLRHVGSPGLEGVPSQGQALSFLFGLGLGLGLGLEFGFGFGFGLGSGLGLGVARSLVEEAECSGRLAA